MQCHYSDVGVCRSCTLMGTSYDAQISEKDAAVRSILASVVPTSFFDTTDCWRPPFASAESRFRNKAKLVVGGTLKNPTLGILGANKQGIDLRECALYEETVAASFPTLEAFIGRASLTPFDVLSGRGELKNIIVTASPAGNLMIRFVLRSTESVIRIRKHLDWLLSELPRTIVVTANILPERKAVIEGDEEIFLTTTESLPMQLGDVTLYLRPQSFFQTNTAVALGLYQTAREWVRDYAPSTLWDLYCGVGGFALHCAVDDAEATPTHDTPHTRVTGVEISEQAAESARLSAAEAGIDAEFLTGDAFEAARTLGKPEFVIVNPPRRGIGELATWLNNSGINAILYSSCNPTTLAKDIAAMTNFSVVRGQIFDMFPHSGHVETLALLTRVK